MAEPRVDGPSLKMSGPSVLLRILNTTVELTGGNWRIAPTRRPRAGFRKFSKEKNHARNCTCHKEISTLLTLSKCNNPNENHD